MKKLILLCSVILIAPFILSLVTGNSALGEASEEKERRGITMLAVGYDDVAENTDAIVLINYNFKSNELSFLQIPRDTIVKTKDGKYSRINSIYSCALANGDTEAQAMDKLTSFISGSIGISIDGYVGFNTKAFKNVIDALGGINIELPFDFVYRNKSGVDEVIFRKGENILSGDQALRFVRYRQGYSMGDLGRVDAQKLFISAFAKNFRSEFGYRLVARLILKGGEGLVSNLKVSHLVDVAMNSADFSSAKAYFATLPGRALELKKGNWFYAVNKSASVKMIDAMNFDRILPFDTEELLLNEGNSAFSELYYSEKIPFKIYDDKSVFDIVIK